MHHTHLKDIKPRRWQIRKIHDDDDIDSHNFLVWFVLTLTQGFDVNVLPFVTKFWGFAIKKVNWIVLSCTNDRKTYEVIAFDSIGFLIMNDIETWSAAVNQYCY